MAVTIVSRIALSRENYIYSEMFASLTASICRMDGWSNNDNHNDQTDVFLPHLVVSLFFLCVLKWSRYVGYAKWHRKSLINESDWDKEMSVKRKQLPARLDVRLRTNGRPFPKKLTTRLSWFGQDCFWIWFDLSSHISWSQRFSPWFVLAWSLCCDSLPRLVVSCC